MQRIAEKQSLIGGRLIVVSFVTTIFLSASLLFFVQPLFAKIVLPVAGGGPAVWTTAMLFFQAVLILGYLYAHLSVRYLSTKVQVILHMGLWAMALFFLPPSLPEAWQLEADKAIAPQVLMLFALGIGAPFALLSSNAPLIQSWYSNSGGPSSDDPYFLYASSNFGSLIALLAFPLVAEQFFGASTIALGFTLGFICLGAGLLLCGLLSFSNYSININILNVEDEVDDSAQNYLTWCLYAFVPSSLMLAVTSKLSTDIGAVPLIWVLPLALYLLSFVVAFGRIPQALERSLTSLSVVAILAMLLQFLTLGASQMTILLLIMLLFGFFLVAVFAHRALFQMRPSARHLTKFYLCLSLGGALGGLFNSIIAPSIFNDLAEGPITLAIALLIVLQPFLKLTKSQILRAGTLGLGLGMTLTIIASQFEPTTATLAVVAAIGFGIPYMVFKAQRGPALLAISCAVSLPLWLAGPTDLIHADRSFFGLHRVLERDGVRLYSNGNTVHGAQSLADIGAERPKPLSYYHPMGPMGQVLLSPVGESAGSIGIIGLGVGSLACYARPGQSWHMYEIDAVVDRIARTPEMFTFLDACGPDAPTHLGDARVVLEGQTDLKFDILIVDAYSSNSVPVHLTTNDAIQLYLNRLTEDGVLLFHISNRYYDIGKPLSRSAKNLGVFAWRQFQEGHVTDDPGFKASDVVMIAANRDAASSVLASGNWTELQSDGGPIWTDDKANPLSILKTGLF